MKGIVSESNAMRHPTYGRVQLSDAVVELPSSHAIYQAFVVRRCQVDKGLSLLFRCRLMASIDTGAILSSACVKKNKEKATVYSAGFVRMFDLVRIRCNIISSSCLCS